MVAAAAAATAAAAAACCCCCWWWRRCWCWFWCWCCCPRRRGGCWCWQHVRLPPRGVCRFLCWHVLKLEFWHFARPKLNLGFVFPSVFAVFSSKKCHNRRAALSKNMLSSPFRIVFFGVFLCVSHFASVFAVFWPSLDFLHMPASTCICLSTLCGFFFWGGGGWGGVMTSMQWLGRGGGVGGGMTSMRPAFSFCFVDLLLIVLVVISGYLLLGFPHVDHAKTSRFCNFPDKNFENDAKIELKKARKTWYLRHFRKNATKKQERRTLENESTDTSCC